MRHLAHPPPSTGAGYFADPRESKLGGYPLPARTGPPSFAIVGHFADKVAPREPSGGTPPVRTARSTAGSTIWTVSERNGWIVRVTPSLRFPFGP
jgi:hypothetical protein